MPSQLFNQAMKFISFLYLTKYEFYYFDFCGGIFFS